MAVPANRIGYLQGGYSGTQRKVMQEVITMMVFALVSVLVLGESLRWTYFAAFGCRMGAAYFIFWA